VTAGTEAAAEPTVPEDDAVEERAASGGGGRVLRLVALIGLGLTIALYVAGFRWRFPFVPWPSVLGVVTGFAAIWLAAAVAVELVHRHHRAAARHGLRLGRVGALTGARYGGQGWRAAHGWATRRWGSRFGDAEDFPAAELDDAPALAGREDGWRAPAPLAGGDAAGPDLGNGDPMDTAPPAPAGPSRRAPARGTPAVWRALAAAVAGFEPETHEEMKAWLSGNVAGAAALAEGFTEVYEHCRDVRKLDPKSISGLREVHEAAVEFMKAIAYARQRYAAAHRQVEEFSETSELPERARDFFGDS
jgi:hypothetical protein